MKPGRPPDTDDDVDLILRHISRQLPVDFAQAILPPGVKVTSATWMDTQVTARQRRLDRALDVQAGPDRRVEHTEWQLRWKKNVPFRMHEYHQFMVAALVNERAATPAPRRRRRSGRRTSGGSIRDAQTAAVLDVPVRSTVVLLAGRDAAWAEEGSYRTSPPDAPFSGTTFRIDPVYQRTVAELEHRDSLLWLIFTPLAVDADAVAMRRVVATLRERAPGRVFDELVAALLVMADTDGRRRGLRQAILPLLNKERLMASWLYTQGIEKGIEKGQRRVLVRQLQHRFGPLAPETSACIEHAHLADLERWADLVLTAATLAEVLDSTPGRAEAEAGEAS